jgi:hypothetical protein
LSIEAEGPPFPRWVGLSVRSAGIAACHSVDGQSISTKYVIIGCYG